MLICHVGLWEGGIVNIAYVHIYSTLLCSKKTDLDSSLFISNFFFIYLFNKLSFKKINK